MKDDLISLGERIQILETMLQNVTCRIPLAGADTALTGSLAKMGERQEVKALLADTQMLSGEGGSEKDGGYSVMMAAERRGRREQKSTPYEKARKLQQQSEAIYRI